MKNDGGPVYPMEYSTFEWQGDPAYSQKTRVYHRQHGISLRAHYAGQAMQGMCTDRWMFGVEPDDIAHRSYKVADAMLGEANYRERLEQDREELIDAVKESELFLRVIGLDHPKIAELSAYLRRMLSDIKAREVE